MEKKNHYDLSKSKGSITAHVESLIGKMNDMTESEIRDEFIGILHAEDVNVSEHSVKKWEQIINRTRGKFTVMHVITNLYLAGCNLSSAF
jgi:hypothetical protein